MMIKHLITIIMLSNLLSACATTPIGYGDPHAKTPAQGAAGGATAINPAENLKRCGRPVGTMAISEEDESAYYKHAQRYGLNSPADSLRLFAQQSNCFVVVERGATLKNTQFERQLDRSGELRPGSNFVPGLMAGADYTVTPTLIFQDTNAGGTSGGLFSALGEAFIGATGKVKYKDAQAILTMIDNRSGIQVSIAEGSARGVNKHIFIGGLAAPLSAAFIESYAHTHQEKIIIGAYLDAFNNLVKSINNYVPQRSVGPLGHGTGGALKVN